MLKEAAKRRRSCEILKPRAMYSADKPRRRVHDVVSTLDVVCTPDVVYSPNFDPPTLTYARAAKRLVRKLLDQHTTTTTFEIISERDMEIPKSP